MKNTALTLLKRIKISPQPAIAGGRLNATRSCYHGPIHSKISNNKASDCHNTQLSFVSQSFAMLKSLLLINPILYVVCRCLTKLLCPKARSKLLLLFHNFPFSGSRESNLTHENFLFFLVGKILSFEKT